METPPANFPLEQSAERLYRVNFNIVSACWRYIIADDVSENSFGQFLIT